MNNYEKISLLIGSPKINRSTSLCLAEQLIAELKKYHHSEVQVVHLLSAVKGEQTALMNQLNQSQLLIVSFPIYVDTLPAHVIEWLLILDSKLTDKNQKDIVFITNCGFPETIHTENALDICRHFAFKSGLRFRGNIAIGCGGAIVGRELQSIGKVGLPIINGISQFAYDLVHLDSSEIVSPVSIQPIPTIIYSASGNLGWNKQAKKYGQEQGLKAKPFIG